MRYERLALWWLPVYIITCALGGGILFAGATYWNVTYGLYAGAVGAAFGILGWLFAGIRIPTARSMLLEAYKERMGQLELALDLGLGWKERAQRAEELLTRTLAYLAHKPFDSITVGELYDDIQRFFASIEEERDGREEGK